MDPAQIADLTQMVNSLCTRIVPCPSAPPAAPAPFSDPRDVCTMCNGVLDSGRHGPVAPLGACLSTVNWACCTDSPSEVRSSYDFCPYVPESGWAPATVGDNELALVKTWWNRHCAGAAGMPNHIKAAFAAQLPAMGYSAGMATLGGLKHVQNKRSAIRLLGAAPVPPQGPQYAVELAASMRRLAAARPPCDAALRSSANALVHTVLCENGRRC